MQQAAFGIVDIQEFYNMNTTDITNGILKVNDVIENRSEKKFSLDEILLIADAAGKSQYFDRKVEWLYSALSLAKTKHDQKLIKVKIQKSKHIHDKAFEVISRPGNFQVSKLLYWTRNVPFNSRSKSLKKLQKKRADRLLNFENNFENLIYTTKSTNWLGHDLMFHMKINYRKQTQQLCANKVKKIKLLCSGKKCKLNFFPFCQFVRPAYLEKNLHCIFLHHGNPFLKMGPFKYECLNKQPSIGFVHDLISKLEASQVKIIARKKMKATPYWTGDHQDTYSRWRTSKVMYINERQNSNAKRISRKIELVTNCILAQNRYDSENFQVNNYTFEILEKPVVYESKLLA